MRRFVVAVLLVLACAAFGSEKDYRTNEVTITVNGADGKPLAGASVRAWSEKFGHFQPWTRYSVAKTDKNGQVKFKMIVGPWSIFAASDGVYLADTHRMVSAATKSISLKPTGEVSIEAKDEEGKNLSQAEVHMYTAEYKPAVPLMPAGKLVNGKAKIATMGNSTYGVMLIREPKEATPGLMLHWDRVKGAYKFAPNKDHLRKLDIKAIDPSGKPGKAEVRFTFPEITSVHDFRSNPGEFSIQVDGQTTLYMEQSFLTLETVLSSNGWTCRYFPVPVDLVKQNKVEIEFGGVHTIDPKLYVSEGTRSQTWLRTADAAGHLSYEINTPEKKLPALTFNFRDKEGKRLYGNVEAHQWAPAVRFDRDFSPEVASWDGVIDYGPFGKREFKGDPRFDEFAYKMEVLARGPHFELLGHKDPQIQHQLDVMLPWMEHLYNQYAMVWNLPTYVADKPITVYYEPNLSNAYGGLAYGNKQISTWLTDLLDFADPSRNALCHMQNIMCHEYFHTCQAIPEMKWGGRSLYPDPWIGESMPQVAFNRIYLRYYGPVVAKMHKGIYMDGFLKLQAGEKGFGNKESIWEQISDDCGDDVHRQWFELVGDENWKPWNYLVKSDVDIKVAILAVYKHITGKNYAYMARLAGDVGVTDKAVDEAAEYLKSDSSPFPEKVSAPFITDWLILGPIEDSKHEFLAKEQIKDEGKMNPKAGDQFLGKTWTALKSTDKTGFVDFELVCGAVDHAAGYAYTTVNAPKAGKVWMYFGSDDGAKVWLNGKLVLNRDYHRPATADDFIIPVELKAGKNTILVKCDEDQSTWGLYLRFADAQGNSAAK